MAFQGKGIRAYEQIGAGAPFDAGSGLRLNRIPNCWIKVEGADVKLPGGQKSDRYYLTALPELSWSKRANYNAQPIIGRPAPVITYAHSGAKSVTITLHMHAPTRADMEYNIAAINYLASALHPRLEGSYAPPPICQFHCGPGQEKSGGQLRSPMQHFRFVLTEMKQNMGSEAAWDPEYMMPRSWDLDLSGDVVYTYRELPGSDMVLQGDW